MSSKRRRALPPVPADASPQLRQYLQAMQEIAETGEGTRGDPLDRKLSIRDLIDSGFAKLKGRVPGYIDPSMLGGGAALVPSQNMQVPPRPQNVNFAQVVGAVIVSYRNPFDSYKNHAYTEVWRAEGEDSRLDVAMRVGVATGPMYTDYTAIGGNIYRYWVRHVSLSDTKGPWHKPEGSEIVAQKSARLILQELNDEFADTPPEAGEIGRDFIIDASRFAVRIGSNPEDIKIPFAVVIGPDDQPVVVMQNVLIDEGILGPINFGKIRDSEGEPVTNIAGKLLVSNIDVENLRVTNANISGDIWSSNFEAGVSGWRIWRNGDAEFNAAQIRGQLDFGQITVQGRPASEVQHLSSVTASAVIPHDNNITFVTGMNDTSETFLDSTPTGRFDVRGGISVTLSIAGELNSDRQTIGDGGQRYYPVGVSIHATISVYSLLNGSNQILAARKTVSFQAGTSTPAESYGSYGLDATISESISEFISFSALGHIGIASSASVGYRVEVSVQRIPRYHPSGMGNINIIASLSATADDTYAYLNRF